MTVTVQPFITTFAGSLDAKGRVCIPAAYRLILGAQDDPQLAIGRHRASSVLVLAPLVGLLFVEHQHDLGHQLIRRVVEVGIAPPHPLADGYFGAEPFDVAVSVFPSS